MTSPRTITFTDPHRRKHFEFFAQMDQPHFNIVANVDITPLLTFLQQSKQAFTPAIVYLISRTANEIAPFRQRIRGAQVVEHDFVHPSFTVPTKGTDVFSFCYVDYQTDAPGFVNAATAASARMYEDPSFEDDPGRDDYLFLSAIPWISFTGLTHAMHYSPTDCVPRISWGKYFEQGKQTLMPLAVQAHHALVDGRYMGAYFDKMQANLNKAATFFG